MKVFYQSICLLLFVCLMSNQSFAQCTELSNSVNIANRYFEDGNLDTIPKILTDDIFKDVYIKPCRTELRQAHLILVRTYLFKNKIDKAEYHYIRALNADPSYEPDSSDIIDLVYFGEKFKSVPHFTLKIPILNAGFYRAQTVNNYNLGLLSSMENGETTIYDKPSENLSLSIGADLTWSFHPNFDVASGIHYHFRSFSFSKKLRSISPTSGNVFEFDQIAAKERQQIIGVPLQLRYKYMKNTKAVPYVFGGMEYQFLTFSNFNTIQRQNLVEEVNLLQSEARLRNKNNFAWFGGIGAQFRVVNRFIFTEVRYSNLMTPIVNTNNRYANGELLFDFGYVDDDIKLDYLELAIGISLVRYRQIVLKNKR